MTASSHIDEVRKLSVLLPKQMHYKLKKAAVQDDRTITDVITALITNYLGSED
jgi:hypothetical protein